jgi:hypothetical protein
MLEVALKKKKINGNITWLIALSAEIEVKRHPICCVKSVVVSFAGWLLCIRHSCWRIKNDCCSHFKNKMALTVVI